jgi:hypothetical protein
MNGIQRTSHQRWPDPTQFNDNFAWLRLIRVGTILVGAVNCDLLLADWFMVPDQMPAARVLRLLVLLPRVVATLFFLQRMGAAARERVALVLGLIVSGISCYLLAGDVFWLAVQVMVAQAMKGCVRQPGDVVARFGGEAFIAVLPQTDLGTAQLVAERVRQAGRAQQGDLIGGRPQAISARSPRQKPRAPAL